MTRIDRIFFWNILTILLVALPRISEAQLDPVQEFRFNDFNHHCVDASGHNVLDRDVDEDGTDDWLDMCVAVANPGQEDGDRDGIGDACDQCPIEGLARDGVDGESAYDCLDRVVDADGCLMSCRSVYTATSTSRWDDRSGRWVTTTVEPNGIDSDNDYIVDTADNCPQVGSYHAIRGTEHDFRDRDGDGIGDVCDKCLFHFNPEQKDGDDDGIPDACDNCASVANAHQADANCDGVGDACEDAQSTPSVLALHQEGGEHIVVSDDVHEFQTNDDPPPAWSPAGGGGFACSVATHAAPGNPLSGMILLFGAVAWMVKRRAGTITPHR